MVQVYGSVADGLLRPPQRLVGFQKVTLDPGDAVEVEVSLHLDGLHTRNDGAMRAPEAPVKLTVGLHANDANAVLLDDV